MEYKLRPGVELVRVCGADLLVPTRTAAEDCGGILRLNGMDAIFVRRIMEGKTTAELCRFYARLSFRPEEEARPKVEKRLESLAERGFLVPREEQG